MPFRFKLGERDIKDLLFCTWDFNMRNLFSSLEKMGNMNKVLRKSIQIIIPFYSSRYAFYVTTEIPAKWHPTESITRSDAVQDSYIAQKARARHIAVS